MARVSILEVGSKYRFHFKKGGSIVGFFRGRINAGEYYYYVSKSGPSTSRGNCAAYNVNSIDYVETA